MKCRKKIVTVLQTHLAIKRQGNEFVYLNICSWNSNFKHLSYKLSPILKETTRIFQHFFSSLKPRQALNLHKDCQLSFDMGIVSICATILQHFNNARLFNSYFVRVCLSIKKRPGCYGGARANTVLETPAHLHSQKDATQ